MKKVSVFIFTLLLAAICSPAVYGQDRPELEEVLRTIDRLYRADSSYAELEMEIVTPNWTRTLRMRAWTDGDEKVLIRILEPERERGVGTLRLGNEMWNYLPQINRIIKIPPSLMMSSWMGSDFTNNDLVSEFTLLEDYTFSYTSIEEPEENTLYIRSVPREGRPIVWGYIITAVDAGTYLPRWQRFYAENNELMRIMNFGESKTFGGRQVPSVIELLPQDEAGGSKTVLRYSTLEFNIPLDEDIFTQRNLRTF